MGKGNNKNKNSNQAKKPVPAFNKGGIVPDPKGTTPVGSAEQPEKGTPAGGPTDEQIKDYENAESKALFDELVGKEVGKEELVGMEVGKEELKKAKTVTPVPEKGYGAITPERWNDAQIAERQYHTFSFGEGLAHYHNSYKNYFHHVGLGFDLHGLTVIEIGPADFPALYYCHNFKQGIVIEPMNSVHLRKICEQKGLTLVPELVEDLDTENLAWVPDKDGITEVWLFNVMQHIADPDGFIAWVKHVADRVRFFEPINLPVEVHHPQSYSIHDFQNWFGDCVQLYAGGHIPGFHTADCAYGVYIKPKE